MSQIPNQVPQAIWDEFFSSTLGTVDGARMAAEIVRLRKLMFTDCADCIDARLSGRTMRISSCVHHLPERR